MKIQFDQAFKKDADRERRRICRALRGLDDFASECDAWQDGECGRGRHGDTCSRQLYFKTIEAATRTPKRRRKP